MFLLRVPKRSIRQQKIKNLLLMALRSVTARAAGWCVCAALFHAAGNTCREPSNNRAIVLLLDNSYSMRYGDNFSKLKAEANKRIDAMGAGDRMAIVAFNDNAELLTSPTGIKLR